MNSEMRFMREANCVVHTMECKQWRESENYACVSHGHPAARRMNIMWRCFGCSGRIAIPPHSQTMYDCAIFFFFQF